MTTLSGYLLGLATVSIAFAVAHTIWGVNPSGKHRGNPTLEDAFLTVGSMILAGGSVIGFLISLYTQ